MSSSPVLCEETILHPERIEEARADLIDPSTAASLAETFAALGDPTRVRIVSALLNRELCVCDLAALLGMTQSAVSHQLRVLRNLRLARARKEGRVVYYTLDDRHIEDLFILGLEHVRHPTKEEARMTASQYRVEGMDCADCARHVEEGVAPPGGPAECPGQLCHRAADLRRRSSPRFDPQACRNPRLPPGRRAHSSSKRVQTGARRLPGLLARAQ